jgi:outer membrane lipoprotein-sorting protein
MKIQDKNRQQGILIKSISILLMIGFYSTVLAQPKAVKAAPSNEPEAEKYLKAIKLKLKTLKGYKLNFTTEVTDADNKKQTYKGSYMGSGDLFELELPDVKTINDGNTQWVINKSENEINISKYSKPKQSKTETPVDIIKNYSTLFKYRVKEPAANNQIVLELIPLNKNTSFFKVDLTLNIRKNHILAAKLYDRGGHRILFKFTDMTELTTLPSGAFFLNSASYKNYEIIDMR